MSGNNPYGNQPNEGQPNQGPQGQPTPPGPSFGGPAYPGPAYGQGQPPSGPYGQPTPLLAALGHAFFTLSLASGAILTYGSYIPDDQSIARTTFMVAIADTCVALLAGLAIFPIIFANGMDPTAGPGLIFMSLPLAFQQMPFGTAFGVLFFAMVSIAAGSSVIGAS